MPPLRCYACSKPRYSSRRESISRGRSGRILAGGGGRDYSIALRETGEWHRGWSPTGSAADGPGHPLRRSWEKPEFIEAITLLAISADQVMLKPQLWGRGTFPGDIHFDAPRTALSGSKTMHRFLEFYANLVTRMHADIFCVGVEFVQMSRYEAEWRKLIARAASCTRDRWSMAPPKSEFEGIRFGMLSITSG